MRDVIIVNATRRTSRLRLLNHKLALGGENVSIRQCLPSGEDSSWAGHSISSHGNQSNHVARFKIPSSSYPPMSPFLDIAWDNTHNVLAPLAPRRRMTRVFHSCSLLVVQHLPYRTLETITTIFKNTNNQFELRTNNSP